MPELRREATRYREAHVGRARDSWVTLSTAYQNHRRKDLQLLALPPAELAARLPPARPTRSAVATETVDLFFSGKPTGNLSNPFRGLEYFLLDLHIFFMCVPR